MTIMTRTNAQDGEWITLPLVYNDNSETDTGYDLPAGSVIYPWEMFLEVTTLDATETINVGIGMGTETGYDADGFIAAKPIDQVGLFCVAGGMASASGAQFYTATDGSNQNYLSANFIGALFFGGLAGGNAAGTSGIMALKAYIGNGTCKSICYTCSAGSNTFAGNLIFRVHNLPIGAALV